VGGRYKWRVRKRKKIDAQALQRRLREHRYLLLLLKFLFRGLQINLGIVLLIMVLPMQTVPVWLGLLVSAALTIIVGVRCLKPERLGFVMRWILYLVVPTLVYLGEQAHLSLNDFWLSSRSLEIVCNLSFLSLVSFSLLVLRFTRRDGYRSTPLDFLILVVAILVPTVIPQNLVGIPVGLLVVKVLAIFFAFEIVLEESRSHNRWLEVMFAVILLIVGVKSFGPGLASMK